MSATQKILAACFIALMWLASITLKHFYPDLDTAQFNSACFAALVGLGAFHAGQSSGDAGGHVLGGLTSTTGAAAAPGGQGGFVSMRLLAVVAAVALSAALFGCAAQQNSQSDRIKQACALDAGIRPSVTALLAIPNLATGDERAAVTAARSVIDPICANPDGQLQGNALAVVTSASAAIVGIAVELQARKAGPK